MALLLRSHGLGFDGPVGTGAVDATFVSRWMLAFSEVVSEHEQLLAELDGAIGDGDHGVTMVRASVAAARAAAAAGPRDAPGDVLAAVGQAVLAGAGGAGGALYASLLLGMGSGAGHAPELTVAGLADSLDSGLASLVRKGRAEAGDKTMFDALEPACRAVRAQAARGAGLTEALDAAARAAREGRDATTAMQARRGRASYLGSRSIGHQDPGATSTALLFQAASAAATLAGTLSGRGLTPAAATTSPPSPGTATSRRPAGRAAPPGR